MMSVRRVLIALVALAPASGCGDAFVDPFLRDGQPYSMYGLIVADVTPLVQKIRVQRIRSTVEPPTSVDDPRLALDGTIVTSAPTPQWTRQIVAYDDGTAGTVFEATFQPAPGTSLEVAYEDAAGHRVGTTLRFPAVPSATVADPVETTEGGVRRIAQQVTWDAPRLGETVVVDYESRDREGRVQAIQVTYGPEAFVDGGTTVEIDLLRDLLALYNVVNNVSVRGTIPGLRIRMTVYGLTDTLPPRDVVPTEDLGRVYVQGATAGRVTWAPPDVVLFR